MDIPPTDKMATFYRFEIWQNGRLDMAGSKLYRTFDEVCRVIDDEISNCPDYGIIETEKNPHESHECVYCRTSDGYEFIIIRMNVNV